MSGLGVLAAKAVANGYASLDASSRVVQNPAGGAILTGLSASGTFRRIGNGVNNLVGGALVTLGIFVRNANEQVFPTMWVQQNTAGLGFGEDRAAIGLAGASVFFERTVNVNEFAIRALNNDAVNAIDVEWAVYGIIP